MSEMTKEVMDLVADLFSTASMIGYATSSNERKSHGDAARKTIERIRAVLDANITQPAQAVDAEHIEMLRDLLADYSKVPSLFSAEQAALNAAIRAISTEKSGRVGDDMIRFLRGEAPLEGIWFGDRHPGEDGRFWWRTRLPASPTPDKEGL